LGMRIVTALIRQIGGRLDILPVAKGTTFLVTVRGSRHDIPEHAEAPSAGSGIETGENAA
jgi:hypothetical protein